MLPVFIWGIHVGTLIFQEFYVDEIYDFCTNWYLTHKELNTETYA
jgi:hypothetical protein